jgi:hypothetical protein
MRIRGISFDNGGFKSAEKRGQHIDVSKKPEKITKATTGNGWLMQEDEHSLRDLRGEVPKKQMKSETERKRM